MKRPKPKKSQAITIAPARSVEGKARKPKMVDKLVKSTWMKIDDHTMDEKTLFREVWD